MPPLKPLKTKSPAGGRGGKAPISKADSLRAAASASTFFRKFTPEEADAVLTSFYSVASPGVAGSAGGQGKDRLAGSGMCVFLASAEDKSKCAKCGNRRKKHGTLTRRHKVLPRNEMSYRMNKDDIKVLAGLPEEVIENLFDLFDSDGDGQIDKQQFGTFVCLCTKGAQSDKLKFIFRLFDEGNSGQLTKEDLTRLFETLLKTTAKLGTDDEHDERRVAALLSQALGKKKSLEEDDFVRWASGAPSMMMFLRHLADAWLQAPTAELQTFNRQDGDKRYRVLALDGGGVRGVMQAVFIARIEEEFPGFIDSVDLFAGTSVGALLACSYALGYPPEKVEMDFTKETPRRLVGSGATSKKLGDYKQLFFAARYDNSAFKQGAIEAFGDLTLRDLRKRVLIPTFKLKDQVQENSQAILSPSAKSAAASKEEDAGDFTWAPKFYHNFHDGHHAEKIADVCLRSMAAPTYFPSYQGHIDGGVVANNPGMVALTSAIGKKYAGQDLENVVMFSIGCGDKQAFIETGEFSGDEGSEGGELNWSVKQWARPLMQIMAQASAITVNTQLQALLGERYHRLSPILQGAVGTLNPKEVDRLHAFAKEISLDHVFAWLRENWF